ncbi:MAG: hypothetical protein D6737_03740 [Chloroflexi bacterium]|nr:MAG: hypothetical protein CUN54_05455 [Phototrophicales bacterium]RMF81829.1 MAG: hypothetical protein D6737_03740 [Chloroflexota bacterium]
MNEAKSSLIGGFISMGASSVFRIVFGFLNVMIAARVIPEEDLGRYFLIISIAVFTEMIFNVGLNISATRFVSGTDDDDERARLVGTFLFVRIFLIALLVPVVYLARPLLELIFDADLIATLFIFIPIVALARLSFGTLSAILQGYHYYNQLAVANTLQGGLSLLFTLVFVVALDMGVDGYLLATIVSIGLATGIIFIMLPFRNIPRFDKKLARKMLRFGLPLQGNDLLTQVFVRLDVWVLGALVGPLDIAYLQVSARIPSYANEVYSTGLNSIYFPRMSALFSRDEGDEAAAFLNHLLRLLGFASMLAALGLTIFQTEITTLIFSDRYLPAAPAMGLIMIAAGFALASEVLEVALIAAGHPSYVIANNTVMTGVTVGTNLALIPMFGFMGAVFARLISNIVVLPVVLLGIYREKIKADIMIFFRSAFVLGICLVMYYGLGWQENYILKSLLLVLFIALSFLFSVVSTRDLYTLTDYVATVRERRREAKVVSSAG